MGLLGALGAGIASAADYGSQAMLAKYKSMIDEEKAQRLAEFQSELRIGEKKREADDAEERTKNLATRISDRAEGMTTNVELPKGAEEEAKQGALRINDMKGEGLISSAEAEDGYKEVQRQRDAKGSKKPTTNDYLRASAMETGDWSKVAASENKDAAVETRMKIAELQASVNWAKLDAQTQTAIARLDAAIARGEKSGNVPTQIQQIEYLILNGMSRDDATKLVYHPEGKVGEYDSVTTKRSLPNGDEETTVSKRKRGEEQQKPSGTRFKWDNGKLIQQ